MRHRIADEVVDLLERRPDPLRRGLRLVRDMHADQADQNLALTLPVGSRNDRLHAKEPAWHVTLGGIKDLPREFDLGGTAPIRGVDPAGEVEPGVGIAVAEGNLAVDIVDAGAADVAEFVRIHGDRVMDEIAVLVDQGTGKGLVGLTGLQIKHRKVAYRREVGQHQHQTRTGALRRLEYRQSAEQWRGRVCHRHELVTGRGAGAGAQAIGPEHLRAGLPQGPVGRTECAVSDGSRRLSLVIRRPVDRQEHLPCVEVEQPLYFRELLLCFQPLLQCDIDVSGEAGGQCRGEVGKIPQVRWWRWRLGVHGMNNGFTDNKCEKRSRNAAAPQMDACC